MNESNKGGNMTSFKETININMSSEDSNRFALLSLTSLFFMWGFITCLNDILIPHLKAIFELSYTQAMMVQFCFFGAYFLVSIPASLLIKRVGYQQGIVVGLLIAATGCVMFFPAAALQNYSVFLLALFILASGITVLQVSANPYVSILGKAETAPSRLTMTQGFNALGTTIAPFFGALLILDHAAKNINVNEQAEAVQIPYLLIAGMLFSLAALFAFIKLPRIAESDNDGSHSTKESSTCHAWQFRQLRLGVIGIFCYVGAEVSIGSFLVSFLAEPSIAGLAESQAAHYIAYYWGGAMVGRFVGAVIMQKVKGGDALAFNALAAIILLLIAISSDGMIAMWAILLVGLCNSIMFPTIFSLAVTGLGKYTSQGSGLLCLAIVGGAVLPLLQGVLADSFSLQSSFILPALCLGYIVFYGLSGCKVNNEVNFNKVIIGADDE